LYRNSIGKRYPGHAKKVIFALWATTTRYDSAMDVTIIDKAPTDTLDHASPLPDLGSKMEIDATRKGKDEGFNRDCTEALKMDAEVKMRVDRIWKELGIER
jgi:4-hydroxy-3-polyprenylbenzoate decarboxylase